MGKIPLIAVAGGLLSALLYVSVVTGTPVSLFLAYGAPLPLFAVGLGLGWRETALAGAVGAAVVATFGGMDAGAIYLLADAAPAVLVSRQALLARTDADGKTEWFPPGPILAALAGYAVLALIGLWASLGSDMEKQVAGFLQQALDQLLQPGLVHQEGLLAARMAALFPAAVAGSWLLMTVLNIVIAQGLLRRFGRALRPSPAMADLFLPHAVDWAVAVAGVAALAGSGTAIGYVGRNAVLVLAVPYVFQGLGVIHFLARHWGGSRLLLALVYVFVVVVPVSALALAGLGFVEQWARLRRRVADAGPGKEEG